MQKAHNFSQNYTYNSISIRKTYIQIHSFTDIIVGVMKVHFFQDWHKFGYKFLP